MTDSPSFPSVPKPEFGLSHLLARPELTTPSFKLPRNVLVEATEANYASEFYKRLSEWIQGFDAGLDNEHEVGVRLVNFGQAVVFHLESMGYWNPSLLSFRGRAEDGQPVELIQHVSQISILLMKLPRKNPEEPKRPIGFSSEMASDEKPAD